MVTSTLATAERRLAVVRPWWRRQSALAVHAVSLVVASAVLFSQLPGQWFFFDEFEYLGSSRDQYSFLENLLRPHNEHWSVLTGVTYGVLRDSVGLRSYWPYVLPVLAVHLLTAHLLWRLMFRLRADPWVATGLAAVFAMAGAGYENVVWAFQLAFVASTACGLAATLIIIGQGPLLPRRRVALVVLSTVNLTVSGLGVVWLVVCGLLLLRRCGPRIAMTTLALPLSLYVFWILWFHVETASKTISGSSFVMTMFEFVLVGLVATGYRLIGMEPQQSAWGLALALGVVLGLVATGWSRGRSAERTAQQAAWLALFAPLFYLVASTARVREADGVGTAVASRYYYSVVVSILPLVAILLTGLLRRSSWLVAPVGAAISVLVIVAAGTYVRSADGWRNEAERFHRTALAEMDLLQSGADVYPGNPPETLMFPGYLTQADLRRWIETDEIERRELTDIDRATASLILQVKIEPSAPSESRDCSRNVVTVAPSAQSPRLLVRRGGLVGLTVVDPQGVRSRPRNQVLEPGTYALSSLIAGTLELVEADGSAGLCPGASPES
jgi:hypothetical protein